MADIDANFSRAAVRYDEHAELQRLVREECIRMGAECWQAGASILDLGHGTGSVMQDINGLGWDVTGLDRAFGMCEIARGRHGRVVNASCEALPFASRSFDGIFSSLMLQWLPDPLATFKEMARVIRPNGRCVVATLVQGTLNELHTSFAQLDDAAHVNAFADAGTLTALMVHHGFTLAGIEQETFTISYPDVRSLMQSIKAIGASTITAARRKGLMTPKRLLRLDAIYRERFGKGKGKSTLPASWHVLYVILEKN